MKYYYKDDSGQEVGPIEEDTLKAKASEGVITPSTEVRNAMVKTFKPAKSIACLKGLLIEEVVETPKKGAIAKNIHRSMGGLKSPPLNYRLIAFAFDMTLCAALIIILFNVTKFISIPPEIFVAACPAIIVIYYTAFLGLKAQTFGYWFFGIMVVNGKGDEVLVGRAFFMSLFFLLTLPLTPLTIFIFKATLHELMSGTQVVNTKLG